MCFNYLNVFFESALLLTDDRNIVVLCKQTVKTVQSLFIDIVFSDMSHEEFKKLCKEAWREKCDSLQFNRLVDEEKNCICNDSK